MIKGGSVEAGAVSTCGTGRGGGQETATGTLCAQAAISIVHTSEVAFRLNVFIICPFFDCQVFQFAGFRRFLRLFSE